MVLFRKRPTKVIALDDPVMSPVGSLLLTVLIAGIFVAVLVPLLLRKLETFTTTYQSTSFDPAQCEKTVSTLQRGLVSSANLRSSPETCNDDFHATVERGAGAIVRVIYGTTTMTLPTAFTYVQIFLGGCATLDSDKLCFAGTPEQSYDLRALFDQYGGEAAVSQYFESGTVNSTTLINQIPGAQVFPPPGDGAWVIAPGFHVFRYTLTPESLAASPPVLRDMIKAEVETQAAQWCPNSIFTPYNCRKEVQPDLVTNAVAAVSLASSAASIAVRVIQALIDSNRVPGCRRRVAPAERDGKTLEGNGKKKQSSDAKSSASSSD